MEKWGNRLIIVLIISFCISQVLETSYLDKLNALLTIIVMITTLYFSRNLPKVFSLIIILIGTVLLIYQGLSVDRIIESVTKNLPLVSIIIVVPILSIPIQLGKYNEKIAAFFSRFNRKPQFVYMISYSLFYLLGPITNLGSIHIIHSMLQKLKLPAEFLGRLYTRGFSSINTWAPYFASVFLVVYFIEIPMYIYLPFGLLLSLFQFGLANILFSLKELPDIKNNIEPVETNEESGAKGIIELTLSLLLLITVIFVIEPFINFNVSVLIVVVAIIFSLTWSFYLGSLNRFFDEVAVFIKEIVKKQSNEIALFLSAGFFAVVLSNSSISHYISLIWNGLADQSVILLIYFTILLISLLSFLGIHQIVIVSTILANVTPEIIGIHDIIFAMTLLSAWAIASIISPIAPMNVVSSNLVSVNVFRLIFKWNFLYAFLLAIIHTIVIYITHLTLDGFNIF